MPLLKCNTQIYYKNYITRIYAFTFRKKNVSVKWICYIVCSSSQAQRTDTAALLATISALVFCMFFILLFHVFIFLYFNVYIICYCTRGPIINSQFIQCSTARKKQWCCFACELGIELKLCLRVCVVCAYVRAGCDIQLWNQLVTFYCFISNINYKIIFFFSHFIWHAKMY